MVDVQHQRRSAALSLDLVRGQLVGDPDGHQARFGIEDGHIALQALQRERRIQEAPVLAPNVRWRSLEEKVRERDPSSILHLA